MGPPDHVLFEDVSPENVGELEKINMVIFPIKYPPKVYQDIVRCAGVSFLASVPLVGDGSARTRTVGGISCRLENTDGGPILYIITLGVLAPYRNAGLGSALLRRCLDTVRRELPEVVLARLHVQVSNADAIRFYEKHGFRVIETVENYYLRTEPRHAVVLELRFSDDEK